jgi:hypothetical protein
LRHCCRSWKAANASPNKVLRNGDKRRSCLPGLVPLEACCRLRTQNQYMRPNGNKFQRRRSGWSPRPSCWSSGDCDIVGRIRPTRNRQLTPSRYRRTAAVEADPLKRFRYFEDFQKIVVRDLPDLTLLASDPAAFSPRASVAGCDRTPERPLDCPSTDRSLRLATGATIYRSRSGLRLWRCRHPAASSNGYTGSADLATVAMAKRIFEEADRFNPTGLS